MVEFLNGGLDNEWTDLFGHFNLELDEINPWTFLDTFRNLIFLSTFYQAARQSLHKMWLWIYKAQKLPPRCDILTGMWLLADKNWHASELYFGAIQRKGLGNLWLLQHPSICFFYHFKKKGKMRSIWTRCQGGMWHVPALMSRSDWGHDAGNMSFDEILWRQRIYLEQWHNGYLSLANKKPLNSKLTNESLHSSPIISEMLRATFRLLSKHY